jgi:peptidyl-dipeptidase A
MNGIETIYNTAKICPFDKKDCNKTTEGLTLDPEITAIMTSSKSYDELEWAWKEWRDNSGKLMRTEYKKYVDLVNKAATLNGNYRAIINLSQTFMRCENFRSQG